MISWLKKFRISTALDENRRAPRSAPLNDASNGELRQFGETLSALDRSLKDSVARPEIPSGLHESIMSAVQNAEPLPGDVSARDQSLVGRGARQRIPADRPLVWHWLAAPGAAALVLLGAWLLWRNPARPESAPGDLATLTSAVSVLQAGDDLKRGLPVAAIAPLANEWNRIQQDLDNTETFLLASVP